jgi:hypothetical protein
MHADSRRRLQAFVDRVEKIRGYPFFQGGEKIAGMSIRIVDGRWEADFPGPPDHETDAVLYHIRLLIGNDDVSIGRLEEIAADPAISDLWKEEYERWRSALNARLALPYAEGAKGSLTCREALEMAMHGERGHYRSKDRAYKRFQHWVTGETERLLLQDQLYQLMILVVACANNIAVASRTELAQAPGGPGG